MWWRVAHGFAATIHLNFAAMHGIAFYPGQKMFLGKKSGQGARFGFDDFYDLLGSTRISGRCLRAKLQGFFLAGNPCDCLRAI